MPTLIVINDIAYVHGGLPSDTSKFSAAELNRNFSADLAQYLGIWQKLAAAGVVPNDEATRAEALIGEGALADPSNCVGERALSCEAVQSDGEIAAWVDEFTRLSQALVHSSDSPFWYRGSVYCRDIVEGPILDAYLNSLAVSRVVVGHTPTADARVRAIRQGKVIMADTGMLVSYYNGRPAALIIENGETLVQYLNPHERVPPDRDGRLVAYGLDELELNKALTGATVVNVDRSKDPRAWQVTLEHDNKPIKAVFTRGLAGTTPNTNSQRISWISW